MKKLFVLILCAAILSGCTETEVNKNDSEFETIETEKEVEETEPVTEITEPVTEVTETEEIKETETIVEIISEKIETIVEETEVVETLSEVVEDVISDVVEVETEAIIERVSPDEFIMNHLHERLNQDSSEMPYNFIEFFKHLTYKTTETIENGDTATVMLEITSHDLSTLLDDVASEVFVLGISAAFSGEEFDGKAETTRLIDEKLITLDYPMITKNIPVIIEYTGSEWKLVDGVNNELLSALMGGMMPPESSAE